MKILILGSVALPVPPPMAGGTERIAYYQAQGLVQRGHEVTLVASHGSKSGEKYRLVEIGGGDTVAGSKISMHPPEVANRNFDPSSVATTSSPLKQSLRASEAGQNFIGSPAGKTDSSFTESSRPWRKEAVYLSQVSQWLLDHGGEFDVIVNNMRAGESIFLPIARALNKTLINVAHLPIFDRLADLFRDYQAPVITISDSQRRDFPDLDYLATVYNGVDLNDFNLNLEPQDYLLMMASIAPHKNQKEGIEVARRLGVKLIIAGKVSNESYWEKEIAPLVDGDKVVHLGEIGLTQKRELYEKAKALFFPILWEEPFGLVMIEAMACGTPVIAYNQGSVPEVVSDGKTGFIIEPTNPSYPSRSNHQFLISKTGVEGLAEAVSRIGEIDRAYCRKHVEEKFTINQMIDSLEKALKKLL